MTPKWHFSKHVILASLFPSLLIKANSPKLYPWPRVVIFLKIVWVGSKLISDSSSLFSLICFYLAKSYKLMNSSLASISYNILFISIFLVLPLHLFIFSSNSTSSLWLASRLIAGVYIEFLCDKAGPFDAIFAWMFWATKA